MFVFFLYFFPQLHSGMHHRKILPIKAMTGVLAALVPPPCSLVHMRARAVGFFYTAGLVSYWGSLNICFSKEKAVQWEQIYCKALHSDWVYV